jgi:hypothetical protein
LRALDPVLRLGVAVDGEQGFLAHSWLEVRGYTYGGDSDFAAFGEP